MPERNPSFSYVPLPDIAPIICPHCEAEAYIIRRSPHPDNPKDEIRIFECKDCNKQTEIIVESSSKDTGP
jgi:transposase-like protein